MKIPKLSSPEASTESSQAAVRAGRYGLDSLLDALAVAYIRAPRWGWVAPTLIVLLAGVLRFYNLAHRLRRNLLRERCLLLRSLRLRTELDEGRERILRGGAPLGYPAGLAGVRGASAAGQMDDCRRHGDLWR